MREGGMALPFEYYEKVKGYNLGKADTVKAIMEALK
jgi:hypothetical protein